MIRKVIGWILLAPLILGFLWCFVTFCTDNRDGTVWLRLLIIGVMICGGIGAGLILKSKKR